MTYKQRLTLGIISLFAVKGAIEVIGSVVVFIVKTIPKPI